MLDNYKIRMRTNFENRESLNPDDVAYPNKLFRSSTEFRVPFLICLEYQNIFSAMLLLSIYHKYNFFLPLFSFPLPHLWMNQTPLKQSVILLGI